MVHQPMSVHVQSTINYCEFLTIKPRKIGRKSMSQADSYWFCAPQISTIPERSLRLRRGLLVKWVIFHVWTAVASLDEFFRRGKTLKVALLNFAVDGEFSEVKEYGCGRQSFC